MAAIAAGHNHALALKLNGSVLGWGSNNYAQVGDGFTLNRNRAMDVLSSNGQPLTGIQAVTAGEWHSMALSSGGAVLSWGRNSNGQLGDGTTTDRVVPTDTGLNGITAITAGAEHSLALTGIGEVRAWGRNDS